MAYLDKHEFDPELGPDPRLWRGLALPEHARLERLNDALDNASRIVRDFNGRLAMSDGAAERTTITLLLDTGSLTAALAELENPPAGIVQKLLALFESGEELVRLDVRGLSAAGKLTVCLNPSNNLEGLVVECRSKRNG